MSYRNVTCIVLKSVNYKDADKIFTLYSKEEGRITATAKGVRKISSKRAGSLDTLNLVRLSYFEGTNEHKTITEVKNLSSFRNIKSNKEKMGLAYKIVGLLLKNVDENSPDEKLFSTLEKAFNLMDDNAVPDSAVLLYFYINFMNSLGYKLQLSRCVFCGAKLSKDWLSAWFSIEKGGLVCNKCRGFEDEIGLRGAALLNKVGVLEENNIEVFRRIKNLDEILSKINELLDQYLDFKL
ncbi:MAG TPA: DNA repair protein RecO [bacterium]|nr:DNA repair protein RecO [bacterium]